ncbi:uncharacterized protein [Nicotiana sylvestris]|uniref:Uncharacterized protein LOC104214595 n=1 Tax=Nicotiana sylvestris TaxID=4096 RepID=A0A1U7VL68_NICSY|nr:PREDICTED: uncharacterized protein LOC104214595 [Nicotiana sylvestris]
MGDISETLAIKRWWRFRAKPSLLETFLKQKYCVRAHPATKKWASGDSHLWKSMTQARQKAEIHMIWQVNSGSSSFLWDNWTGKGALATEFPEASKSTRTLVNSFIANEKWNEYKLREVIPTHMVQHILTIEIGRHNINDNLVWDLTENGKYTNKSTYGEAARKIWNLFGGPLGIAGLQGTIRTLLNSWWQERSTNAIHKLVIQIVPIIVCWELWKQWCVCMQVWRSEKAQYVHLKHQISWMIQVAVNNAFPNNGLTLPWINLVKLQSIPKSIIVCWETPKSGTIKLNTDGSYNANSGKAGLGGILRDDKGNLVMAFSHM